MFKHLGTSKQIFTHHLFDGYYPPDPLDWDHNENYDPFISNKELSSFNAD